MRFLIPVIIVLSSFAWSTVQVVQTPGQTTTSCRWIELGQAPVSAPLDSATQQFLGSLQEPLWRYCATPYLQHDEMVIKYFAGQPRQATGLMVGLLIQAPASQKVMIVHLTGPERLLALDTAAQSYQLGQDNLKNGQGFSWEPMDIDGDGATDLLGQHSAGTACFSNVYVFYYDGKSYRQVLLVDAIALGDMHFKRDRLGRLNIIVQPRGGQPPLKLIWQGLGKTKPLRFGN
jgi:hypothetical protein